MRSAEAIVFQVGADLIDEFAPEPSTDGAAVSVDRRPSVRAPSSGQEE
jgi:hypothetical protein